MHGVPSSEVVNKEVIETHGASKEQGEAVQTTTCHETFQRGKTKEMRSARAPTPVSFNLVLALVTKRVALGKSQTIACIRVTTAFLNADMRDEVCIKM